MNELNIHSSRLRLVAFKEKHLSQNYVDWLNDRELMRFSEQRHLTHTLTTCQSYAALFEGSDNFFWAIEEKQKGIHIGNITAYIDQYNSLANVSLLIGNESFRGKGYGQEAWDTALDWLLNNLKIRKITAGTMEVNKPMLKIMRRSGMRPDGVFAKHYLYEGQPVNIKYMSKFSQK